MLAGLGAALVAAVCFGSVFVPIKKSPPSDAASTVLVAPGTIYARRERGFSGFVVQFFLSIGALLVAIVVHAIQGFPQLYPLAMLGGFIWSNAFAIQIMNRLGMALGMLVWNTVILLEDLDQILDVLSHWMGHFQAFSPYGLFGVPKVEPASILLNYIGIGLLILGAVFYIFVKSNPEGRKGSIDIEEKEKTAIDDEEEDDQQNQQISFKTKLLFLLFALISGFFYGSLCTPVTFIQSHNTTLFLGAPSSGLPYVLPFFLGVFVTSLIILIVYSVLHQEDPLIDGLLSIRSIFGGILFGLGITCFFVANELLSPTVAYPLIAMAPGLVVSLWSVVYFREITGRRNLIFLGLAYSITLIGVSLVTISKEIPF